MQLTCDTDSVNIVRNDSFRLDDLVELGPGTMQDDGIEADAREEAQA